MSLRLPTPAAIRATLRTALTPGPRMVDEGECVFSVLLGILFAHLIGAHGVGWAAFTAFILMRGHVAETLRRGAMRIVGTALGAGLALAVVPHAARWLPAAALAAAIVGAVGLYGMLTAKRGYAWLLFGLTFEIILLDKIERPAVDALAFARTRLLEVCAGTLACVIVSAASTFTARRHWPAPPYPRAARIGWHPQAARHALQTGATLALLPVLHALFGIPELEQAGVTIMAVMIVPVAGLGAGGLAPVTRRLLHRAVGCLGGSLLAGTVLVVAHGIPALLIAGTMLGVMIGRHIENAGPAYAYVGVQFSLAILVVLVPDSYADVAIRPALERLASILIGMALLEPVLLLWHLATPRRPAAAGPIGESGE